MSNSAEPTSPHANIEEPFLDLLIETLEGLERSVRGQFLQRFFKSIAQVELTDTLSLEYWERILQRRQELAERLGKPVSLKTAIVDVLAATNFLKMPILVEYEELKKLQVNAATDALTGLYNRRLFEEYFAKELNRAKRYGQHLGLVIMDLHKFKQVNDRYGHLQGDQALQAAASTLRKTLRTSDYAFRIGGDEFALLLPQTDPEQAGTLSRRLRSNYDTAIQPMKFEVPLALDYGVAVFPEDADQVETMIRTADERLYELKNAARLQPLLVAKEPAPAEREAPAAKKQATPTVPAPPTAKTGPEQRKWERVSLVGTRAYAVLGEDTGKTARVLDLSYGGVGLETNEPDQLGSEFQAVLHVPILPPVKVNLRTTYVQKPESEDKPTRVGCSFIS